MSAEDEGSAAARAPRPSAGSSLAPSDGAGAGATSPGGPGSRASRALELAGLALLALLPLVPYLVFLLDVGAPRYTIFADHALMEHETLHVFRGETLLGLGSRFRWHHPGPLLFYFCAPFQKLWGSSSTGFYVGTWTIAALSAAAPVVATRLVAGRAHAIGVLAVTLAWFAAFGNLAVNPWVRTVVVLPFMAYFVLMALFARGASACALPGVLFGAVVVQTHVASASTVGVVGVLATGAFLAGAYRRRSLRRRDLAWLGAMLVGALVVFAPLVIEQLRAPPGEGNVSKLLAFARERQEPLRPWSVAFKNWVLATSWLPDRLLERSLLHEGALPAVMRWEPVPVGISRTAGVLAFVHVVAVAAASVVALRRRDVPSLALLALGALGSALAVSALRALVGEEHYSLVVWTTVPSNVGWIGVATTAASALAAKLPRLSARRTRALVALGLVAAAIPTALNRSWLARNPEAPGTFPDAAPSLRALLGAVEQRLAREDAVPVVHMMGAWTWATAVVLELEKDGVDVRVADADTWSYAGVKAAQGAPRVVHLYFEIPADPLPVAPCVELLAEEAHVTAYASATDVVTCAKSAEADR
ncbi:MAG: hypothetical protein KIS78_13185 [Labilithrix sp.]|nr:hypothetical protein [Labilithrix sp.]